MTSHHPTPELLTAFSAGSLHLSHALCVAAHVEYCDECKVNLSRLDSVGAELFEEMAPQPVSSQLKSNVLARLDVEVSSRAAPPSVQPRSAIPRALRQFIPTSYDELKWQTLSPSIRAASLCVDTNGARVELLRIKPGGRVASHSHTADEFTVILDGSFSDETGVYREGDFVVRDSSHQHRPVATKDKECICLVVTDGPIRFAGFLGRLLNPFIRKRYLPV